MKFVIVLFLSTFITFSVQATVDNEKTVKENSIKSIQVAEELAYEDIEQAFSVLRGIPKDNLSQDIKIQYALTDLRLTIISGAFDEAQHKIDAMKLMKMPDKYLAVYYQYAIKLSQILENYVQAFQYLNYADQLSDKNIPLADWVDILLVAADLNIEAGTVKTSQYWLDKAQKIADETNDYAIKCNVISSYVYLLNSQEKYVEFSNLQNRATEICQKANDVWVLRMFKVIESLKLKSQGNFVEQERALLDAIELMGAVEGEFNYQQTQLLLAESYINQGKTKLGKALVTRLYDAILAYDLASDLATLHRLKSMIAKQQGDNQRAVEELNKSVSFQDKYDQAVNENQLLHLNAQFVSSNNKLQNQLDKLVKQRVTIDEEIIRFKAFLTYAIAMLTLIGVVVITSMYMRRQYLSVITADKHDALTGLLTQHGAESELESYCQYNKQHSNNVSLALISIDELAMIKHSFSVDKADRVLANTAAKLTESINGQDVLFRYDDDTFALIIFQRNSEDITAYLRRITTPFRPKRIARLKTQTLHLRVIYTDVSIIELSDRDVLNTTLMNLLNSFEQSHRDEQGYVTCLDD